MNLHGIVRGAIGTVNPHVTIYLSVCTGNTTAANGKQMPSYDPPAPVEAQIQPLSTGDIKHMDSLNIQGVMRSVFLYGAIAGINRVEGRGGDLLAFPERRGGPARNWLVSEVAEQWPDWCRVIVTLQDDAPRVGDQ